MIAAEYCAVVFDLDGTLADTATDIREALVSALSREGLPPIDVASVRLMIGGGPKVLVERALHRLGVPARDDLVDRLVTLVHDGREVSAFPFWPAFQLAPVYLVSAVLGSFPTEATVWVVQRRAAQFWMAVTAAPCSDDIRMRRRLLPSVRPKPRSSGSRDTFA